MKTETSKIEIFELDLLAQKIYGSPVAISVFKVEGPSQKIKVCIELPTGKKFFATESNKNKAKEIAAAAAWEYISLSPIYVTLFGSMTTDAMLLYLNTPSPIWVSTF